MKLRTEDRCTMKRRGTWQNSALTLLLAASLVACAGSTRLDPVPAALRGQWTGDGKIAVVSCPQERLAVSLSIAEDGRVQGQIGEATLRNGYLSLNRGALLRWLDFNTDYIVRGELEGSVVAQEKNPSKLLYLPFNLAAGPGGEPLIEGGVTTAVDAGSAGKEIPMAASGVILRRTPATGGR